MFSDTSDYISLNREDFVRCFLIHFVPDVLALVWTQRCTKTAFGSVVNLSWD